MPQTANSAEGDNVRHKPFIYAYSSSADMELTASEVREKLLGAGFTIVGEYSPYDGVMDIVVTNSALQTATSATDFGSFGAVQRVSLTKMGDNIQVAYVNPTYLALAYRLEGNLAETKASMEAALGNDHYYGSRKGVKTKKLRRYRYMGFPMFTERFDKPDLLATYASHDEAVAKVEEGLAAGAGGVSQVYRVDIEGTTDTLFGVGMTDGCSGDTHIMGKIDFEDERASSHLPYEVLVKDNEVYALGARFRIAISFPDLKMVGKHSFAGIMCAPGAIKNALRAASGNPK
ncbi:MAG: hypothetical protein KAR62_05940 [Sphingomonadales bacterium]|nr:hypothetical protein [Sphingomonadales bacterium]